MTEAQRMRTGAGLAKSHTARPPGEDDLLRALPLNRTCFWLQEPTQSLLMETKATQSQLTSQGDGNPRGAQAENWAPQWHYPSVPELPAPSSAGPLCVHHQSLAQPRGNSRQTPTSTLLREEVRGFM